MYVSRLIFKGINPSCEFVNLGLTGLQGPAVGRFLQRLFWFLPPTAHPPSPRAK